jgi:hypothetical protein
VQDQYKDDIKYEGVSATTILLGGSSISNKDSFFDSSGVVCQIFLTYFCAIFLGRASS